MFDSRLHVDVSFMAHTNSFLHAIVSDLRQQISWQGDAVVKVLSLLEGSCSPVKDDALQRFHRIPHAFQNQHQFLLGRRLEN